MADPTVKVVTTLDDRKAREQTNQLAQFIEQRLKQALNSATQGSAGFAGLGKAIQSVAKEANNAAIQSEKLAVAQSRTQTEAARTALAEEKVATQRQRTAQQSAAAAVGEQRLTAAKQAGQGATAKTALSEEKVATQRARTQQVTAAAALAEQKVTTERAKSQQATVKAIQAEERLAQQKEKTTRSTGLLGQALGASQVAMLKFNNVVFFLQNAMQVLDMTIGNLYRTAKEGAVIAQTAESFQRFAEKVAGVPDLLERARVAAKGTIDDFSLMAETLTLVSGLGPQLAQTFATALTTSNELGPSLLEIARAAQILNPALGEVDFFLKSLSIGIKRNERRWIDNLGIVISAREAYQRFAEATGKSVLAMTAEEKQLATLNEVQRVGALLIDQLGGATESQVDSFSRMEANITNLKNSIKVAIAEAFLPLIQILSGDLRIALAETIAGIQAQTNVPLGTKTVEGAEAIAESLAGAKEQAEQAIAPFVKVIDTLQNFSTFGLAKNVTPESAIKQLGFLFEIFGGDLADFVTEYKEQIGQLIESNGEFSGNASEFVANTKAIFAELGEDVDFFEFKDQIVSGLAESSESFDEFIAAYQELFGAIDTTSAGGRLVMDELREAFNTQQAISDAESFDKALLVVAGSMGNVGDSSQALTQRQNELRDAIEQTTSSIVDRQLQAFRDLATAQEELDFAQQLGTGIEQAQAKVNQLTGQISQNWRDMILEMFQASSLFSESGALQIETSLGTIDQKTADSATNFLMLRDATSELFVAFADPSLTQFGQDIDNVTNAAALLASGSIDLTDAQDAARQAIAQVADGLSEEEQALIAGVLAQQALDAESILLAQRQEELNQAVNTATKSFVEESGQAKTLAGQLVLATIAAGASAEQTLELAVATGVMTQAQADGIRNTALMGQKQAELAQKLKLGQISAAEMTRQMYEYARSLGIATGQVSIFATAQQQAFGGDFASGLTVLTGGVAKAGDTAETAGKQFRSVFLTALEEIIDVTDDAEEETKDWNKTLFDLVKGSDASIESIIALGIATGQLTQEQAAQAFAAAAQAKAVDAIATAYVNGALSADQAAAALAQVQAQIASGQAVDLSNFGIDLSNFTEGAKEATEAASGAGKEVNTWRDQLLDFSAAAGVSNAALVTLAQGTGKYSDEMIRANLVTAKTNETAGMFADLISRGFDAEVAAQKIGDLESALNKLTLVDLAEFLDTSIAFDLSPEQLTDAINMFVQSAGDITIDVAVRAVLDQESASQLEFDNLTRKLFPEGSEEALELNVATVTDTTESEENVDALADKLGEVEDDSPYEVGIDADTTEAMSHIQQLLDAIPDEIVIPVRTDTSNYNIPEQPESGGGPGRIGGYEKGGYTGAKGGVVHPFEFVMNERATSAAGVANMERLQQALMTVPGGFERAIEAMMVGDMGIPNTTYNADFGQTQVTNDNRVLNYYGEQGRLNRSSPVRREFGIL